MPPNPSLKELSEASSKPSSEMIADVPSKPPQKHYSRFRSMIAKRKAAKAAGIKVTKGELWTRINPYPVSSLPTSVTTTSINSTKSIPKKSRFSRNKAKLTELSYELTENCVTSSVASNPKEEKSFKEESKISKVTDADPLTTSEPVPLPTETVTNKCRECLYECFKMLEEAKKLRMTADIFGVLLTTRPPEVLNLVPQIETLKGQLEKLALFTVTKAEAKYSQ